MSGPDLAIIFLIFLIAFSLDLALWRSILMVKQFSGARENSRKEADKSFSTYFFLKRQKIIVTPKQNLNLKVPSPMEHSISHVCMCLRCTSTSGGHRYLVDFLKVCVEIITRSYLCCVSGSMLGVITPPSVSIGSSAAMITVYTRSEITD